MLLASFFTKPPSINGFMIQAKPPSVAETTAIPNTEARNTHLYGQT